MGLMVLHRVFWRWFVSSRIWLLLPVIQVCSHLFLFAVVTVAFNRGFVSSSVLGFGFLDIGGSKCSSIATSSSSNLPRCGCELPMKLWVSNTGLNPKRKFWKCRNSGTFESCEFVVWDDELHEVNAANGGGERAATMQLGAEFGKAFGQEFDKEIGNKLGQFVWVAIMMCGILVAMLFKSM
ncbi:hypothetical protein P8452_72044 [Trifolium repens]|nr:hypothetical protein P8452_72044 [Trifolium repens]